VVGGGNSEASQAVASAENLEGRDGALLDLIAVAKQMSPEELALQKEEMGQRKKHYAGAGAETIDWEDGPVNGEERRMPWGVIGFAVIALTLLVGGTAYYFKELEPASASSDGGVLGDAASRDILDNILNKDESAGYLNEEGVDTSAEAVDLFDTYDMEKVEKAVQGFLNAGTIEERLKFSRDPERVGPLMEKYYEDELMEAEGFEAIKKTEISYRGAFVTTMVQTGDFMSSPIAVERIGEGEGSTYVVDWESWVGYCDVSAEEMRRRKPVAPMMMRVLISPENYYNYGFSDDSKWRSYRLELRNSEYTFLAYAKKNSELDHALSSVRESGQGTPYLIKAVYPPGGRAKDQIEIVEIVSKGWIYEEESEREDE